MALTKKELCDFLMKERTAAKKELNKIEITNDDNAFYQGKALAFGKVLEFVQEHTDDNDDNIWHSVIKGDMPNEFGMYLVLRQSYISDSLYFDNITYNPTTRWWYNAEMCCTDVKYWAELPELPKEELV